MSIDELQKQLDQAYSKAADQKDYATALSMCEALIRAHPESVPVLRTRAQIHAHKADFGQAVQDITTAIEKGPAEPGDYFFRGWWNLEAENELNAIEDLTHALRLGEDLKSDYFCESAHFFRAVAAARLGRYDQCLADCEHVRDDFLMYLKAGQVSKQQIVREAYSKQRR